MLVERSRLDADPGTALAQTKAHRAVRSSGSLRARTTSSTTSRTRSRSRRDDAVVGKRMFFFLGLPGVLLAAFLAAYAGSILASTERRERANLRIRGAHRGHLLRMLVYKTLALAGVGSVLGRRARIPVRRWWSWGGTRCSRRAAGDLGCPALAAIAVGMLTTALALYVPGRRSLTSRGRARSAGRCELVRVPAWRRRRLDFVAAGGGRRSRRPSPCAAGAFDPPTALGLGR